MQIATRVELAEVAGDEEAVGAEFGRGLFRHVPVAGEHVRPLHLDHADFTGEQLGTGLGVGDANLDAGQGTPHGARNARTVVRIGGDHAGLGHSVTFEDLVSGPVFPVAVGLCQQRRRTGDEQPHIGGRALAQVSALQQANIEGRHAHQHGRPRHRCQSSLRVEFLHGQDARTRGERHVASHEQPVDMIDRQRVN